MKPILNLNDCSGRQGPLNPMKTGVLLFCGLAVVLSVGCSHKMVSAPQAIAFIPAATESTELPVPLPAQTPFDGNPKARAAYLEYYATGYRLAVTSEDYASPGCLCTAEGDPERYEATVSGFYAGKDAGAAALTKKRQQNQKAPGATPGAPSATPLSQQR
jgi:hypothetical protein